MKTFKVLGLLLTYPEQRLYDASDELLNILNSEAILPKSFIKDIKQFLDLQKGTELFEVQEGYVATFDQSRAHSLHLFEHIHGESRDRGQAMVDLIDTYAQKKLYISKSELPDYLPLFLEYLSCCNLKEASDLLGEAIDIIAMIGIKLGKRKSPYAVIFKSIEQLSSEKIDQAKITEALKKSPKDPETFEELDKEWKEAEAFSNDFMENSTDSCNNCDVISKTETLIERMVRGA